MCLDALLVRGLTRTNIGIARYAFTAHGVSLNRSVVATGLLNISPSLEENLLQSFFV